MKHKYQDLKINYSVIQLKIAQPRKICIISTTKYTLLSEEGNK